MLFKSVMLSLYELCYLDLIYNFAWQYLQIFRQSTCGLSCMLIIHAKYFGLVLVFVDRDE